MKKISLLLFALSVVFSHAYAQLSGIYTIGAAANYPTIQAAVTALNTNGISADVDFRIKNGTYNEQVTINDFNREPGAETATVTFRKSLPFDVVNWQYSAQGAANNWVVRLNGAKFVTFRGITFNAANANYGNIFNIENTAADNTIESCTFNGLIGIGNLILQSGTGNLSNHIFRNNIFNNGDKAIDFDYIFGGADSTGLQIIDNTFVGQNSGSIDTGSSGVIVTGNTINSTTDSDISYNAITLDDSKPIVENNTLDLLKGNSAIWIFSIGGSGYEARIVNNFIALRSSTATRGIYVATNNVSVYHNTVRSRSLSAPALYISSSSTDIRINNNILINDASGGGGLALRIDDGASITSSNDNDLYSTGSFITKFESVDYNSLSGYSNASGLDIDSVKTPVTFVDTTGVNDLHLLSPSDNDAYLLAPTLPSVVLDYDGDTRSVTKAYKGADEGIAIAALDNADTTNGFYTIGGISPDYMTPNAAISELKLRGMKGPVTFRIRAGTYTTHQTFRNITKFGNANDLIYFRSANLNNKPNLQYNASNTTNNWVIKIDNTSDIEFRGINFLTTATGMYGRLLEIIGDSDNITLKDATFTGVSGQTSNNAALVFAADANQDNYTIANNTFINGSIALNLITPGAFTQPQGNTLIVDSNIFSQQALYALYTNHDVLQFDNNTITSGSNSVIALLIKFNKNNLISKNKFLLTGLNTTAIYLWGADGSTSVNTGLVSNNFILADTGIDLSFGAKLIYMFHNTIVASTLPINIQPSTIESYSVQIQNNILFNNGSGPVVFVTANATVDVSDYNDFYNTSGNLLDWQGTQYADLTAFQAATSFDSNSTTTAVNFVDQATADLHITGASIADINLSGTPLASVVDDIDNDIRSTSVPYMGADENATSITGTYKVGVNVSGLAATNSVQFRNNNTENLIVSANGTFYFATEILDGNSYSVLVNAQPDSPNQNCVITSPSGTINGAHVILAVVCTTVKYNVGVNVSGLAATNAVTFNNNGTNALQVSSNGQFAFSNAQDDGSAYNVTVLFQPASPNQICVVSSSTGTISGADVELNVNCTTEKYFIGGIASGMIAGNFLTIQNNSADDLSIDSDGAFVFNTPIDDGTNYTISIKIPPNNPLQSCNISNSTGSTAGNDVTNVAINCIIEIIFADEFE